MKFYIQEKDYSSNIFKNDKKSPLRLNQGTSVTAYKKWFFDCLNQFGKIITLNEKLDEKKLKALLGQNDAIFVSVNLLLDKELRPKVPHRFLWLTLGSLLLPHHLYFSSKYLPSAQVDLLSTQFQIDRLRFYLGNMAPEMNVFSNKIDSDHYTIPDRNQRSIARKKYGISEGRLHVVYAGRWIVTKGICQLIRALDIWPIPDIVLTLTGNIEEENSPVFSFTNHKTFSHFLSREILQDKRRPWLRFQNAKDKKELRDLFWSADLFVNPSIQPDENFGVTPREAMACGLPVVTTNFCGLHPLAEDMPWKGVDTYPTLLGSRFSLRQLRTKLQQAVIKRNLLSAREYRDFVVKECDPELLKDNLKKAIRYLIARPPEVALDMNDSESAIKKQLFNSIDGRLFKYYIDKREKLPYGAYIYGDGPPHYAFPIAQGLYSAMSSPPRVEKNSKWRGFFRIAFWDEEKALVEFGFPGPRIMRYQKKLWHLLTKCAAQFEPGEHIFVPKNNEQVKMIQELVDLGYLVSEDYRK